MGVDGWRGWKHPGSREVDWWHPYGDARTHGCSWMVGGLRSNWLSHQAAPWRWKLVAGHVAGHVDGHVGA